MTPSSKWAFAFTLRKIYIFFTMVKLSKTSCASRCTRFWKGSRKGEVFVTPVEAVLDVADHLRLVKKQENAQVAERRRPGRRIPPAHGGVGYEGGFYETKSIRSRYIIRVFKDWLTLIWKASFSRFSSGYKKRKPFF